MKMTPSLRLALIGAINQVSVCAHETAREHGFYDPAPSDGERIALIHSELSEALEWIRQGNKPDDKIPEYTGAEAELADACIRIFDYSCARGWRLGEAIVAKMKFNESRPHKHGKKF